MPSRPGSTNCRGFHVGVSACWACFFVIQPSMPIHNNSSLSQLSRQDIASFIENQGKARMNQKPHFAFCQTKPPQSEWHITVKWLTARRKKQTRSKTSRPNRFVQRLFDACSGLEHPCPSGWASTQTSDLHLARRRWAHGIRKCDLRGVVGIPSCNQVGLICIGWMQCGSTTCS